MSRFMGTPSSPRKRNDHQSRSVTRRTLPEVVSLAPFELLSGVVIRRAAIYRGFDPLHRRWAWPCDPALRGPACEAHGSKPPTISYRARAGTSGAPSRPEKSKAAAFAMAAHPGADRRWPPQAGASPLPGSARSCWWRKKGLTNGPLGIGPSSWQSQPVLRMESASGIGPHRWIQGSFWRNP